MSQTLQFATGITTKCQGCTLDIHCIPDTNQKCSNLFQWAYTSPYGNVIKQGTFTTTGGHCNNQQAHYNNDHSLSSLSQQQQQHFPQTQCSVKTTLDGNIDVRFIECEQLCQSL